MVLSDCYSWANEQPEHARLGDPHRTRRLVSLAPSLAQHAGLSIVKSSHSTAQVEGAYRLIRNPSVSPQAIAEAGFAATARACEAHPLLLALEDTTTINFSHSTAFDDLGNTTTNPKTREQLAHSVLMYAPTAPCQSVLSNSSAGVGPRTALRGACFTESPAGRSTRQALRTAGSPGNRGKPHAERDAKRRTGSPPGPGVH